MIDCEFDTLILSLVLIWIFYVFSFNLQLSEGYFLYSDHQFDALSEAFTEVVQVVKEDL